MADVNFIVEISNRWHKTNNKRACNTLRKYTSTSKSTPVYKDGSWRCAVTPKTTTYIMLSHWYIVNKLLTNRWLNNVLFDMSLITFLSKDACNWGVRPAAAVCFQQVMLWYFFQTLGLWIPACIRFLRTNAGWLWICYAFGRGSWDPQLEIMRMGITRTDRDGTFFGPPEWRGRGRRRPEGPSFIPAIFNPPLK